jgi:putative addiction module CopG family antidote
MTIHLPPELERFVHDQVVAGRYASEDAVIHDALEQLRSHAATFPPGPGSIGAMRDDADLLAEITENIVESRRTRSLELTSDEYVAARHRHLLRNPPRL